MKTTDKESEVDEMTDKMRETFKKEVDRQFDLLSTYNDGVADKESISSAVETSKTFLWGFGKALYELGGIARTEIEWGAKELGKRVLFNPFKGEFEFK